MHLKRFLRPTVREALAAARQSLGPQALVLSTELVQAPGWRGWTGQRVVSLTAGTEHEIEEEATEDRPDVSADRTSGRVLGIGQWSLRRRQTAQPEIESPAPPAEIPSVHPLRAGVVAKLIAAGVDAQLAALAAESLSLGDCRTSSLDTLKRALTNAIAAGSAAALEPARVEVFIGPPGAGKTTTIAKIAAQERVAGLAPRAVIAADCSRVGAVEHLRGYARIIGSPFRIARDAAELTHALKAARRPVLVDTAGRLPSDPALSGLIDALRSRQDVITHLVMPADTTAASASRILDRYAAANPNRIVITKVDEAESAAPLVGVLCERKLTVSYVGSGPRVPRDLTRATPGALAAVMLGELPQGAMTCH